MRLRFALAGLVALVLLLVLIFVLTRPKEASMLLVNGVVYTVDGRTPLAEAVAISGDKIVAVGSTRDITSAFRSPRVIDLQGRAVYPGFIDSHGHPENLGAMLLNLDLIGTTSVAEIQKRVAERARILVPGQWVRGRGWDQNTWTDKQFPTHQMLDEVASGVPVYLVRVDGHAVWVNKKVLDIAGISRTTRDPEGGKIIRDSAGDPTGVFVDNAIELLNSVLPAPSVEDRTAAITRALDECVRSGLTEVEDMGTDLGVIAIYKKLALEGKLPVRVYVAIGGTGETWRQYLSSGPEIDAAGGWVTVRALKLYADGALGSRGAALIEPYDDDPGNRGLTLISTEDLRSAAEAAFRKGFQVCVHAIGDRANNIVLNVYQEVAAGDTARFRTARFRIEHTQVLDSADIPRFSRLGVIPSMQPGHCTSDMPWVDDRIGPQRAKWAYAWRSLIDAGSIIPGGSDFPVESPNPLLGFYAAITRQDRNGQPPGGWHPEQRMTREEALKAYTLWGAYAAFQEGRKGTLAPGAWADIVVLSRDIMKVNPAEIPGTKVEMTMVGGAVRYSAEDFAGVLR